MLIVWTIRRKIIRAVLFCVEYEVVHSDTHTRELFLQISVCLGLALVSVHLFKFSILCVYLV